MSFLYYLTHNIDTQKQIRHKGRKEKIDSLVAKKKIPLFIYIRERASAFTSKGSITLEASIVTPIFFFAILCLAYLLETMSIQNTMRNALYSVGRELAQQAYSSVEPTSSEIEEQIVANIGADKLENSIVAQGAEGIDCSDTAYNRVTGIIELSVQYKVNIPILMFRMNSIHCEEKLRVKGWTGYVAVKEDSNGSETVYVTETGIVYHKKADCTYLDMSIHAVDHQKIEEVRNQSGGKYYPCESCGRGSLDGNVYYITDYGTRYHTSLQCKKIQRNIYAISIDEVYGLGGCSKCVK